MYHGLSDRWLPPTVDIPMRSEEDPRWVNAEQAARHIRLVVQINDWSLRTLAPIEMKTGFGWIQAKPATVLTIVWNTAEKVSA